MREIRGLIGVEDAAGGLTLAAIHVEGTVPEQQPQPRLGPAPAPGGPENIDLNALTVTGVDTTHPALGAITPGQITRGRYFGDSGKREAVLNVSYARRRDISLGDKLTLGGKKFTVVGLAETPLGGQRSREPR